MTTPNFLFRGCDTTRGLISSGEGSSEFFHPMLPTTLISSAGFLICLNGWNLNRCMADVVGSDGTATTALTLLQMRAPRQPITPLLSSVGEGRVFRPGAKWRYRWKDSRTGMTSGLSPLPDYEFNVGEESIAGATTYLGQTAYFYLATADKPAQADTIQLFANSTQEDDVWYLADEQPTGSASYVLLTDNNTDDELFTQLSVVTGTSSATPSGMTWSEGIMPPLSRAWVHPSGRVFYYGTRRFGQWVALSTASITVGSDLVTLSTGGSAQCMIDYGRIGQRVRFYEAGPVPLADPTVYRIVKVESANTFRVYPEIQPRSGYVDGATEANLDIVIEDDRDARWTWMSEPNIPWLIDPLKVIAAGENYDDGVMAWFSLGGEIYMQTNRRIYRAAGSVSDDPSRSTVFIPVAEEGTTGFYSGCQTPFGWVYLNETRGVRVFDGQVCRPLSRSPDTLGEFQPQTQFENFDPAMMDAAHVTYDPTQRVVLVSHVPSGSSCLKETLNFATTERNWRGPNRERISASGMIRSTSTADVFVTGDDFGNLLVRDAQSLDVTPTLPTFSGTGTITAVNTKRVFTDSSAHFAANSDETARGSPIWFTDGTYYYVARIADILADTQVELDGPPVREDGSAATLTTGWTYGLGSIRWSLTTAYIDTNADPAKPMTAHKLDVRFKRGTSSETFEVGASENATGTFSGERTSSTTATAPTLDSNGKVHGELRLQREGALVQIRARGTARAGDPQITRAVLVAEEREGALPK